MSSANPRVLLVGYGSFGAVHARAWLRLVETGRLIIADPSPAAAAAAGEAHPGARIVADWRSALGDADLVDIVTPSDTHSTIALAALEAGRDVLIEKPVATTAAETLAIDRMAEARGRLAMVGYILRFDPLARRLGDLATAGAIGRLHSIEADFISLKRPRRDAGVVLNDAVHFLDLICWLKDGFPVEANAVLGDWLGRGIEDRALIDIAWTDGAVARLFASCLVPGENPDPFAAGGRSRKRLAVTGTDGQIVADFMTGELTLTPCVLERDGETWRPRFGEARREIVPRPAVDEVLATELRHFADCAAARSEPETSVRRAGIGMAALCDAIFAASRRAPILLAKIEK